MKSRYIRFLTFILVALFFMTSTSQALASNRFIFRNDGQFQNFRVVRVSLNQNQIRQELCRNNTYQKKRSFKVPIRLVIRNGEVELIESPRDDYNNKYKVDYPKEENIPDEKPEYEEKENPKEEDPKKENPKEEQEEQLKEAEQMMIEKVNRERQQRGLSSLEIDYDVVEIARLKSLDMRDKNYFAHNSPTYGSPFDMLSQFGIDYITAGENLAGSSTVERAHTNLMNSAGHRRNILDERYTHIGVGVVEGGPYGNYYTQMFIGR